MAEAVIEPAETKPQVIVPIRNAILVNRNMGLWAVFVFSFSSIGLVYSGLIPFSTLAGTWPGANLPGVIGIAGLTILPLLYVFSAIGAIAPRYGADYVVASRVVSPPLAFASSWTLVVFLALAAGSIAASIAQNLIPIFSRIMSMVFLDETVKEISQWATSPTGIITIGTVGIILVFLFLNTPPRVTSRVLFFGVIVSALGWIVPCVLFAIQTPEVFQISWEELMGQGTFWNNLQQARGLGMKADFSTVPMLIAGFMSTLWLFSGSFNPVYFASEIKNPKKNLLIGNIIALIAGVALMAVMAYLLQHIVAAEWLSAESFLLQTGADQQTVMPWLPFYAIVLYPNTFLLRFIGLSSVLSYLMMALALLYTASRIMLAWGEDHLIPSYFTFVHPQLRIPLISVLIVCLLAVMGVVETALNTGVDDRVNPVFFFACVAFLPVLGMTLLPFRRREWFQQSTGFLRAHIGPVPVVTIMGVLCMILLMGVVASFVIWPGFNPLNSDTLLWFGVMFASGLVWFFGRRIFLKRQGQDIGPLLESVPEE